jgi:biopolymer transport protein ExbB/TolQ
MIELIKIGEPFLFANMLVALVALAVIIQRVHSLWVKYAISEDSWFKEVYGFVEAGSFARAIQLCTAKDNPINNIFKAALIRANRSEREMRRGIEVAAIGELPKVRRGTAYMPQLSNVATLFGLIGTIRGLIISFSGVAGGDASTRQAMLSQGISIAFYNTFFGLTVAVLIILAYMLILGRQNKLLGQMELGSAKLVDLLLLQQSADKQSGVASKRTA